MTEKIISENFESKTLEELKDIALNHGFTVSNQMNRDDYISMLKGEEDKSLDDMKLPELREVAAELGIKSPYKYRKQELKNLILEVGSNDSTLVNKSWEDIRTIAEEMNIKDAYRYTKEDLITMIEQGPDEDFEDYDDFYQEEDQLEELNKEEKSAKIQNIDLDEVSTNVTDMLENMEDINYVEGILEILPDGYGFLRRENYQTGDKDVYVSPSQIRRFRLKTGDDVVGVVAPEEDGETTNALIYIKSVNELEPGEARNRKHFDKLVPIYPDQRYKISTRQDILATRMIDLIAPIGRGQRGLIVSPPKSGKTSLLKMMAKSLEKNYPDTHIIVLLIDERPEEVTDMQRSVKGEVVYSTFDEQPQNHIKVAEMVVERAKRLTEMNQDVVILLDSITRLARAYNLVIPPSGRTLSGGLDPLSLTKPKRFFGAARNIEDGGSLTIIATALIETGSRMDDVIYEEFKGTGNMEIHLDRKLSERRIFPAIDIYQSSTRKEELLLSDEELEAITSIRQAMGQSPTSEVTSMILNMLENTENNEEFVSNVNKRGLF